MDFKKNGIFSRVLSLVLSLCMAFGLVSFAGPQKVYADDKPTAWKYELENYNFVSITSATWVSNPAGMNAVCSGGTIFNPAGAGGYASWGTSAKITIENVPAGFTLFIVIPYEEKDPTTCKVNGTTYTLTPGKTTTVSIKTAGSVVISDISKTTHVQEMSIAKTLADILPEGFPTTKETAWKAENGNTVYKNTASDTIDFSDGTKFFPFRLDAILQTSGGNYVYSTNYFTTTFVMDDGVLSAITMVHDKVSSFNGTYAVSKGSGTQADPWKVGTKGHESEVKAYLDGGDLHIIGSGVIGSLDVIENKEEIQAIYIDQATVTGSETNSFAGIIGAALNLPDGWQGDLTDVDGNWYGGTEMNLMSVPIAVKNVEFSQNYPWNAKVTITADVTGEGECPVFAKIYKKAEGEWKLIAEPTIAGDSLVDFDMNLAASVKFVWNASEDLVESSIYDIYAEVVLNETQTGKSAEGKIDTRTEIALEEGKTAVAGIGWSDTCWGSASASNAIIGWKSEDLSTSGQLATDLTGDGVGEINLPKRDGVYYLTHTTASSGTITSFVKFTVSGYRVYTVTDGTTGEHGSITLDKTSAVAEETVEITVAPDAGYQLKTLTVTYIDGTQKTITPAQDESDHTKYTFDMPAFDATVTAVFEEIPKTMTVTADLYEGFYDGQPHNITYSVTDDEGNPLTPDEVFFREKGSDEWIPAEDFVPYTNAMEQKYVEVKVVKAGYIDNTAYSSVYIKPRIVVIHAKDGKWAYDSETHSQPDYFEDEAAEAIMSKNKWGTEDALPGSIGFVGDEGFANTLAMTEASSITEVGQKKNVIDQAADKTALRAGVNPINYEISYIDGDLEIVPATMSIILVPYEGFYDGQAHMPSVSVKNAQDEPIDDAAVFVREKGADDWIPIADFEPYKDCCNLILEFKAEKSFFQTVTGETTIKINPRTVTLVAGSADKTYDNTPLTCTAFTVKEDLVTPGYGFVDGEGIESVSMTGASTIINAGSVDNIIATKTAKSGTNLNNYIISTEKGTLTVNRSKTAVEPTVAFGLIYTGLSQNGYTNEGNFVTLNGVKSATIVGDYSFTAAPDANHAWSDGTTEEKTYNWSIAKATGAITVDTTTITKTYGEEVILPTASSNFGRVSCDKTSEDLANAGTYTVTYTLEGTDNYSGDVKELTVVIEVKEVEKPQEDTTVFTYNGEEQTYTVEESELYEVSGNVKTSAGNYDVTISLKDKSNYKWSDGTTDDLTYSFKIEKAKNAIHGLTIDSRKDTESAIAPSATADFGDVKFIYSKAGENNFIIENLPTTAGEYIVKAYVVGTDDYEGAEAEKAFTIYKTDDQPEKVPDNGSDVEPIDPDTDIVVPDGDPTVKEKNGKVFIWIGGAAVICGGILWFVLAKRKKEDEEE